MDEYIEIYQSHMNKLTALTKQRDDITAQIEKVKQMVAACYNMLSEEKQREFAAQISMWNEWALGDERGLTDAIRGILQSSPKRLFTPIEVRDRLLEGGFDFSGYTSNPLSSVHSVLKRFKPTEVAVHDGIQGRAYQWIKVRLRSTAERAFGIPPMPQVNTKGK